MLGYLNILRPFYLSSSPLFVSLVFCTLPHCSHPSFSVYLSSTIDEILDLDLPESASLQPAPPPLFLVYFWSRIWPQSTAHLCKTRTPFFLCLG